MVLAAAVLVAGCTSATGEEERDANGTTSAEPEPQPLSLELQPRTKADNVAPGDPVVVKAENGKLSKVKLVGAHGTVVKGRIDDDKTAWRSAEKLGYGKQYTLTARGVGADGQSQQERSTFTTVTPQQLASVQMSVPDGATVGVGMPVSFAFSAPISDKDAAEQALQIKTEPRTEGGFYWFSDSWVVWRPKEYWQSGTKVKINANIYGKDLGGGMYGSADQSRSMKIGEKLVAVADGKNHHMNVWIDGKKVKRMPIAVGKPGYNTPHGTYTVMSEHQPYTMDSSTYGVPSDAAEGYKITVTHAARMSYSGIFYHSAPWSEWAQGNTNTSHGCINLSTANADWLMKRSKPGDVIKVKNSGGPKLEPTDGWSFWQLPWKQWQTGGEK